MASALGAAGTHLTFSEHPQGTIVTTQYVGSGIIFSGRSPSTPTFISSDGANPTSPVLSGTPQFHGSIGARFVIPSTFVPTTVSNLSLDVGYIDDPGSVHVTVYTTTGAEVLVANRTGIVRLSARAPNITGFSVEEVFGEAAGFAIDNVEFNSGGRLATTGDATYAALGDSYSAGEGISPFFESGNACHRSKQAYPTKVEIPFSGGDTFYGRRNSGHYSWAFLACSGDTTADVLNPQLSNRPDPSNVNWRALGPGTALVTITVGGNDVHFADALGYCHANYECHNTSYGRGTYAEWTDSEIAKLSGKATTVYRKIRQLAKNARIIVLGYPQLFPASADEQNCTKLRQYSIGHYSKGFSNNEQNFLRAAGVKLNQTLKSAVETAGVGAEFIPVAGVFSGHEVCGEKGEWINGPTLAWKDNGVGAADQSFHPNERGETAYAEIVNRRIGAGY